MTTTYWSQPSWVDKSQDCWLVKFENYSEGIGGKKGPTSFEASLLVL